MIDPMTAAAITTAAAPVVKDGMKAAKKAAAPIVDAAIDWIRCEIIEGPTECRHRKARELYAQTMNQLLAQARAAAAGNDWITAYAIAEAAADLQEAAAFVGHLNAQVIAQWDSIAEALSQTYGTKAGIDYQAGKRPTYRAPGAFPAWLPWAAGAVGLLFILRGRK